MVVGVMGVALGLFACDGSAAPGGGGDGAPDLATPVLSDGDGGATGDIDMAGLGGNVVRFVAVGDVGKGNDGQREVAAAIAQKCATAGCDFVQLLGDNIYPSGVSSTTDSAWETIFVQPYAAINLPFWVVLGNHDYGGNGAGYEFGKGKNEVDYTLVSTKWKLPSAYWHRVAGGLVEMIGLDTNMQMYGMDGQQKSDVRGWLAVSTAKWKIVFGHHPYLSNGPHGNAGAYDGLPLVPVTNGANVKSFLDDVVCGKADVYISGHDHVIEWMTETCQGTELITAGTGAESTELKGSNATRYQGLELGFLYAVVTSTSFTGELVDKTGRTLYARTITK
jgi:hypothetical protein